MQDFSKLNAIITAARRQAVIAELGQLLLDDKTISQKIVDNLHSKDFIDITSLQVQGILGALPSGLGCEEDEAPTSSSSEPLPSEVTLPEPENPAPVSIYPRALPGWDQRATHALVNGHHRSFGLYDIETNYMTLLAGSAIASEWSGEEGGYGEALENILTLSNTTKLEDGKSMLLVDVICLSPACAASLAFGRSISSTAWQDGHGRYMQKPGKNNRRRFGNGFSAQPLFPTETPPAKEDAGDRPSASTKATQASLDLKGTVSELTLSGLSPKPRGPKVELPPAKGSRRHKGRR